MEDWRAIWEKEQRKYIERKVKKKKPIPSDRVEDTINYFVSKWPVSLPSSREISDCIPKLHCKLCNKYLDHYPHKEDEIDEKCCVLGEKIDSWIVLTAKNCGVDAEIVKKSLYNRVGSYQHIMGYEQISSGGAKCKPIIVEKWERLSFELQFKILLSLMAEYRLSLDEILLMYQQKKGGKWIRYGSYEGHPQSYLSFQIEYLKQYLSDTKCSYCDTLHENRCPKKEAEDELRKQNTLCYVCGIAGHRGGDCKTRFNYKGQPIKRYPQRNRNRYPK